MKNFIVFTAALLTIAVGPNAFAQAPYSSSQSQESHAVKPLNRGTQIHYERPMSTPARYFVEAGGGAVGAVAGGLVGGFVFAALDDDDGGSLAELGVAVLSIGIGAAAAMPAGVYLAGQAVDANGSLGWTYLGGIIGVGSGVLLTSTVVALSSSNSNELLTGAVFYTSMAMPLVGAIIGYELSVDEPGEVTVGTLSAPRPMISVSPDGDQGYVGLGWSF